MQDVREDALGQSECQAPGCECGAIINQLRAEARAARLAQEALRAVKRREKSGFRMELGVDLRIQIVEALAAIDELNQEGQR